MFLNDLTKTEEIQRLAVRHLRLLGIKYRPKRSKQQVQDIKTRRRFKVPLHSLPSGTVTLRSGQQLIVPQLLHELCLFILTKVDTEGLFRKGGSKSRQNEIHLSIDAGCYLGDEHHEIDVANVLKMFFRELPIPLFPQSYHDLFFQCMILPSKNLDAVLLACLFLPCEHLNTLTYLMQFLHEVSERSAYNKMNSYNLAVVIGPTLMPIEEKLAPSITTLRLKKICELIRMLIDNANAIGIVPQDIMEKIAMSSSCSSLNENENYAMRKKKRRSGSLTRMFNGIKRMVTNKSTDEIHNSNQNALATPDLLTPYVNKSKKRKLESGAISKRRKYEILSNMPQNSTLVTPYTPVSKNPNPKRKSTEVVVDKMNVDYVPKIMKSQWLCGNKPKLTDETTGFVISKPFAERRWSQINCNMTTNQNQPNNRHSYSSFHTPNGEKHCSSKMDESDIVGQNCVRKDYVRISKSEYEEIKSRVSAIEQKISLELECHDKTLEHYLGTVENVQSAYEQTLVKSESLSSSNDYLTRRLSKELKIRKSTEQKVIRSPSARKIGNIRRRSHEFDRGQGELSSDQVSHASVSCLNTTEGGTPRVFQSSLSQLPVTFKKNQDFLDCQLRKTPTFHIHLEKECHNLHAGDKKSPLTPCNTVHAVDNYRASLSKLRSQNAGMVLQKAKFFDNPILLSRTVGNKPSDKNYEISQPGILKIEDQCKVNVMKKKQICRLNSGIQSKVNIGKSPVMEVIQGRINVEDKENNLKRWSSEAFNVSRISPAKKESYVPTVHNVSRNARFLLQTKSPKRLNRINLTGSNRT